MNKSKFDINPPDIELPWKLTGDLPDGFDVNVLPSPQKGFAMGVIGGRNTGKSVIIFNLIKHYAGCYDSINIFSPTHLQDPTISSLATGIDPDCYHETIDVDFIENLIKQQEAEKKKFDKGNLRQKFLSRHLLIFDDCIADQNFAVQNNQGILNRLGTKGRHFRLSFIVASQSYKSLPKKLRVNIPNFIITKSYNEAERKAITEELSNTLSERKFNELFEYAIEGEYNFFYIFMDAPDKKTCFRKNLTNILKIN